MELAFGCLGNGITVWQKGTNNTVAHIEEYGAYKIYKRIPQESLHEIIHHAELQRDYYRAQFLQEEPMRLYERLLDAMTMKQLVDWHYNEQPHDTPEQLYDLYISMVTGRDGYTMP